MDEFDINRNFEFIIILNYRYKRLVKQFLILNFLNQLFSLKTVIIIYRRRVLSERDYETLKRDFTS